MYVQYKKELLWFYFTIRTLFLVYVFSDSNKFSYILFFICSYFIMQVSKLFDHKNALTVPLSGESVIFISVGDSCPFTSLSSASKTLPFLSYDAAIKNAVSPLFMILALTLLPFITGLFK